ncbi:MAG: T9SS type A sorting domain-containing protein [Bacteroidales bacterium]|nr:T9SS type A sorting domain-containing protein [Saprospiraceae bacterium]MCF8381917.1 T9SS type A sorting domain-containing protein [Bacteroidales bacterium]
MKNIFILFLICICHFSYSQNVKSDPFAQLDLLYSKIPSEKIPTGILFNQGFKLIENIDKYSNSEEGSQADLINYYFLYQMIQKCSFLYPQKNPLPDFEQLVDRKSYEDGLYHDIPISLIYYKGNYIKDGELIKLIENNDYSPQINEISIFASSVLVPKINSANVTFNIDPSLLFSNNENEIESLDIDFGNGDGFHKISLKTSQINIQYNCIGQKSIVIKLLTETDTLISNTVLTVKDLEYTAPKQTGIIEIKQSNLKSTGTVQGGTYRYESTGDLDKPVIIVEGFDILNDYSYNDLYDNWYDAGFVQPLLDNGYDLYFLNFSNNTQSMHDNAEVVKSLIEQINSEKAGNFEGVVIGESMGGLISRIALKEMENDNINHEMGLFVSYDSPHKGANIPYGFQTVLRDALDVNLVELFQGWIDLFSFLGVGYTPTQINNALNSSAAKQLLVRHIKGSSDFDAMQTYLSGLGYPSQTRNIALISGSNRAYDLPFNPGDKIFEDEWGACALAKYKVTINTTNVNTTNQEVSRIRIWGGLCILWTDKQAKYSSDNKAYDNCPGGKFWTMGMSTTGIDYFSFVPSVSSIDLDQSIIDGTDGLHYFNSSTHTKDGIINSNQTPLDDIYSNSSNTGHISLDDLGYWDASWNWRNITQDILLQEIMYDDYYLQNSVISSDKTFIANNSIQVGNNVNPFTNKNIATGDVVFKANTNVTLSAPNIILQPGTTIEAGCNFTASPNSGSLKSSSLKSTNISLGSKFTPKIIGSKYAGQDVEYTIDNLPDVIKSINWELSSDDYLYNYQGDILLFPGNIKPGQYTLKVDIVKSASESYSCTRVLWVNNNLSVDEINENDNEFTSVDINVFPNPTKSEINVEIENITSPLYIEVLDINGRIVSKGQYSKSGKIDLSNEKGMLLLKISFDNKTITRKILCL